METKGHIISDIQFKEYNELLKRKRSKHIHLSLSSEGILDYFNIFRGVKADLFGTIKFSTDSEIEMGKFDNIIENIQKTCDREVGRIEIALKKYEHYEILKKEIRELLKDLESCISISDFRRFRKKRTEKTKDGKIYNINHFRNK
jgi:hypothetical protein